MNIELPSDVLIILNTLEDAGYQAYVVGGCVRDSILEQEPKDWDITTNALPDVVEKLFAHTIPTGKKYGTITVCIHSEDGLIENHYEVTTFRSDGNYSDGRRPDKVTFGESIEEDLERRDFTINAIAYNPKTGLVDPFDGYIDLIKENVVRCVGNSNERFNEDALRILRAIRFATRYQMHIDTHTLSSAVKRTELLENVSKERIHDEIIQILNNTWDNEDLLLNFCPIFEYIFEVEFDADLIERICTYQPYQYKIGQILSCTNLKIMESWLRKYKFSNDDIKQILDFYRINKQLKSYSIGVDCGTEGKSVEQLIRILLSKYNYNDIKICFFEEDELLQILHQQKNMPIHIKDLKVDGEDLKELGYKGEEIGQVLNRLLDKVLLDPNLNTFEKLNKIIKEVKNG